MLGGEFGVPVRVGTGECALHQPRSRAPAAVSHVVWRDLDVGWPVSLAAADDEPLLRDAEPLRHLLGGQQFVVAGGLGQLVRATVEVEGLLDVDIDKEVAWRRKRGGTTGSPSSIANTGHATPIG